MGKIGKKLKLKVGLGAMWCCEYCLSQANYSPITFSIEHIIPLVKSGLTSEENLALACQTCNNSKYSHTTGVDPAT
jgi:5-methylcytosine-specific restriction endonuclease McrA